MQQQARRMIPPPLLSSFGLYPNVLELTENDRKAFHPVVVFPSTPQDHSHLEDHGGGVGAVVAMSLSASDDNNDNDNCNHPRPPNNNNNNNYKVTVRDLTRPSGQPELATEDQRQEWGRLLDSLPHPRNDNECHDEENDAAEEDRCKHTTSSLMYQIGRYDEDRSGLYESAMFHDTSHRIDGFAGKRTVHMGIDLGGPVHTPVYSFTDGIVHASGYNPALGDYGHVIVLHHQLPNGKSVYALYGHLDDSSRWNVGDVISRGQVVGTMGHPHQNGGWLAPHVHFQLSLHPPESHDMPGAVNLDDRAQALQEYPDPRYVLGPLY